MGSYKGWSNYASWAVFHWLEEEEDNYDYWSGRCSVVQEKFPDSWVQKLAEELEAFHDEDSPELAGIYGDLLGWALGSVNWIEVARHIKADAKVSPPIHLRGLSTAI